jgi:hypothetical protein
MGQGRVGQGSMGCSVQCAVCRVLPVMGPMFQGPQDRLALLPNVKGSALAELVREQNLLARA